MNSPLAYSIADACAAARAGRAANSLLDRGYGKPEAKIDASISRQTVIRSPELCASTDEWRKKYGIE